MSEHERLKFITDEYLRFLDGLRESGVTNMYGAAPYLEEMFRLPRAEARQVLTYWMRTFGDPDR